jgi:hypothetical protein
VVARYATGSTVTAGGCGGTVTGISTQLSCSELAVPQGSWEYTVTPALDNWRGTVSSRTSALVDTTAPTTSSALNPVANGQGWNSTDVTVTLTANDTGGSGVSSITYSESGAQSVGATAVSGATASITLSAQGATTVSFAATDGAGNVEQTRTSVVRIDKTAPSVGAAVLVNADSGQTGYVRPGGGYRIYANATDSTSGVSTVTADVSSITGGSTAVPLTACSSGCTISGTTYGYVSSQLTADSGLTPGVKNYSVRAADAAGLSGSLTGLSVTADAVAPTVTVTAPAANSFTSSTQPAISGAGSVGAGDLTTITVKVYSGSSPTGTPVQTLTTTLSGGSWSVTPSTLAEGTYTVQAIQSDAAGNQGSSNTRTFTVDTTAPAVTLTTCTMAGSGSHQTVSPSGAAGTATGDAATVVVTIYNGSGTGGTVFQTINVTPVGATWSTTSNYLGSHATFTVRAVQTDSAGNTGTTTTCTVNT